MDAQEFISGFASPQDASIFSYDDFARYVDIAFEASQDSLDVEDDTADNDPAAAAMPINKAMQALKEEINNQEIFSSFMYRFWALLDLMHNNRLGKYYSVTDEYEQRELHPAVLEVARRIPLNKKAKFDRLKFLQILKNTDKQNAFT